MCKISQAFTRLNTVTENRIKRGKVNCSKKITEVKTYPQLLFISILLSVKYWWEVKPIKSAARKKIGQQTIVN